MRRTRPLATTAAIALMTAACAAPPDVGDQASDPSVYDDVRSTETFDENNPGDFEETVALPGGRELALWYSEDGTELKEQHYSPKEDAWTAPRVLYTSEEDGPCQGITIVQEEGVVAAYVDFGTYCYDGDPPRESVALAAAGHLTEWEHHVTEDFDGWTAIEISNGDEVTWTGHGRTLRWAQGGEFEAE